MPSTQTSALAAVHMLDEDCAPVSTLAYPALSSGFVGARSLNDLTPAPAPAPWASTSPRPTRPARVSVGESSREYTYTPIAELWKKTEHVPTPPRDEKVNIYGVVLDCRAPCTTRGPDLRSEVIVADESSVENVRSPGNVKTMAIYCFERNPADCIPFRSVGDVIRAHRVNYGRYQDHFTGTSTVQGAGRFYSTFLVWSHEGTDFLPIASREPVANRLRNRGQNVTHIVTAQDREKISSLRNWARNYLFKVHRVHRPYLRTVLEVKGAHPEAEFLSKSFDLICRVKADVRAETDSGILRFTVSDGLFNMGTGGQNVTVESTISPEQLEKAPGYQFVDFCPSWNSKPSTFPAWLLIRDARSVRQGNDRVIKLSVGKKTSTLIWHPENSPDVLKAKESFSRATGTTLPRIAPSAPPNGTANLDLISGPEPLLRNTIEPREVQAVDQQMQSTSPRESVPPRRTPAAVVGGTMSKGPTVRQDISAAGQGSAPLKRLSSSRMLAADNPSATNPPVRKAPRYDVATKKAMNKPADMGPSVNHLDEANASTLQRNPDSSASIISHHANKSFKISTIAELQQAVSNGSLTPHRIRASARTCISPRDVRFACRPWCGKCCKFLKVDPNHRSLECLTCSKRLSSTGDPDTEWAYLVRLNLEDDSGCRIECWIEGTEATTFFAGLAPTSLLSNTEARQRVSKSLQVILNPRSQLDCCVKPYEYEDGHGVYRTACKLFGTALLPQFVSR